MKPNPKSFIILFSLLLVAAEGWSQSAPGAAAPAGKAGLLPDLMFYVLIGAGALVFLASMTFMVKVNLFLYNKVMAAEAARTGVTLPEKVASPAAVEGPGFWTNLRHKYWGNAVPIEREGDITFHHAYDGIRELDNRLPPWWVNMFILTIVWAVGYMYFYHWGGNGLSSTEAYKKDVETAKKEMAVALAGKADAVDESNATVLTDATAVSQGQQIYKSLCAACHGQQGEGLVGPNFTDDYWIHGGGIQNIFKVVKYGVPEKGMIAWQAQLKPSDIQKVASYILTLRGTNPANPKAPQGEIWKAVEATSPDAPGKEVGSVEQ
jgi:cytochrome c oxidase cbb3-type subunit 3